jgi:ribosomal-protein-alanine N-acetyltransferase
MQNEIYKCFELCFPDKGENQFREFVQTEGALYNFLQEGNEVSAFVIGRVIFADEAEILSIGTSPAYRKRGLASKIYNLIEGRFLQLGIKNLHLEVAENNDPAIKLYEKLGFERVGVRKNYYFLEGKKINAILLTKFF